MYQRRFIAALFLSLALALVARPATAVTNDTLEEIVTTPKGGLSEVHPDNQGRVWVSEYNANAIYGFNPTQELYTRYSGLTGGVVDAQRGPDGNVWFSGYDGGSLGQLMLTSSTVITWEIPGSIHAYGQAFDDDGNLWVIEGDVARIYRFAPGSHELCTYTLPNESKSVYLRANAGGIWLGDYITDAIIRLDPATKQLTSWKIPTGGFNANPMDLDADSHGNLWWGDGGLGEVGRLEPGANRMTLYPNNKVSSPNFIAVDGDKVWYADTFLNKFGVFNPALAVGQTVVITPTTATLAAPTCANLGVGNSAAVTVSDQAYDYAGATVTDATITACGWINQAMPAKSTIYDIAVAGGRVWVTDFGRDRLVATPDQYSARVDAPCFSSFSYLPTLRRQ